MRFIGDDKATPVMRQSRVGGGGSDANDEAGGALHDEVRRWPRRSPRGLRNDSQKG